MSDAIPLDSEQGPEQEGTLKTELEILETIHTAGEENKPVVQRDLAHIVGVSIGMTNAIIKRLTKKGLLTIRKVNNRNVKYALSAEGMRVLSEKSYRYFKRTIKNVVYYKEKIGAAIKNAAEAGYGTVLLAGKSDLDFIVEHFCMKEGLLFARAPGTTSPQGDKKTAGASGFYIVYSEQIEVPVEQVPAGDGQGVNHCYFRNLIG